MKKLFSVLLLGLAVGVGGHWAYWEWRQPQMLGTEGGTLAWMRTELKLSDDQFARIASLHEQNAARQLSLSARVASLQKQLDSFEEQRRRFDQVDFVAFARFVETYGAFSAECEQTTRRLVQQTAAELDPAQRERYLTLVEPLIARAAAPPGRVVH